ncbi:hypothetical protein Taro_051209, partial [Colocasia esculenta]|nr:hypothetical protein [Colocasia esculenta]
MAAVAQVAAVAVQVEVADGDSRRIEGRPQPWVKPLVAVGLGIVVSNGLQVQAYVFRSVPLQLEEKTCCASIPLVEGKTSLRLVVSSCGTAEGEWNGYIQAEHLPTVHEEDPLGCASTTTVSILGAPPPVALQMVSAHDVGQELGCSSTATISILDAPPPVALQMVSAHDLGQELEEFECLYVLMVRLVEGDASS